MLRRRIRFLAAVAAVAVLGGCAAVSQFTRVPFDEGEEPPPDTSLAYSVFLLGDAGAPLRDGSDPTLRLLKDRLDKAGEHAAVVFLGDNVYPSGLPPQGDPTRDDALRRIDAQIEAVRDFEGRVVFVPGNHDWGGAGLGGNPSAVRRLERYVEGVLDRGDVWVPDAPFPGPVEIRLNDWLTIAALDTQWWLEPEKRYGETGTYLLESEGEVLVELHDILQRNSERDIIVVAHHPLFTNGPHGGYAARRRSLLPAVTRRYLGTPQDLSNYRYRRLRDGLLMVLERHPGLVYAAGHDHSLQYFRRGEQHYVVSGSATKISHVEDGRGSSFAASERGFAVVDYYGDGSTWLSFWAPDAETPEGRLLYRAMLQESESLPVPQRDVPRDLLLAEGIAEAVTEDGPLIAVERAGEPAEPEVASGSPAVPQAAGPRPYAFYDRGTVTIAPGPEYRAGWLREWLFGKRYRDLWALPVEIPVLDLDRTAGGLTAIKRGGGLQTASLRLQGEDGDQYVIRSVNKDPTLSIPKYLRRTVAHDLVADQTSAVHPYAAFALGPMLTAAGIPHTYPTLVYVPDDPRLGFYREEFGGLVALFEMRPDEEQEDEALLGRPENVIGSARLFEKLEADNDHRVDERAYVRARLFDMWINDWDRHDDQWRWSQFDAKPGKVYRPIPRDRDFAMFRFDGMLPRLTRTVGPLAARRFTDVTRGYHDVLGLNLNGSELDRRLTSSLSKQDWIDIADSLAAALTDSAIVAGLRMWPKQVYEAYAPDMLRILKERREKLPQAAKRYYPHLAEIVDVIGSDKHERFEVHRLDRDKTEVVMYKTDKEGEIDRELLRRTFYENETDEVRLYGFGGEDQFLVSGTGRNGIRIRAIGGSGEDTFSDDTDGNHVYFYDTSFDSEFNPAPKTDVIASENPQVNRYDMMRWELDELFVAPFVERNVDDGFLFGGSVRWTKHGFRKSPYASQHELRANYAYRTGAYNIGYRSEVTQFFDPWDLVLNASVLTPHRWNTFFGLGNATLNTPEVRSAFASRLTQARAEPHVKSLVAPFLTARIGPVFEYTNVEPLDGADLPPETPLGLQPGDFGDTYFGGVRASLTVDGRDSLAATRLGLHWINELEALAGLQGADDLFVRFSSIASYFYTFTGHPVLTLAFRAGASRNFGDFQFFQANILGRSTNLRGYHRNRFAGHTSVFNNVEARLTLADLNVYLTRGEFGLYGFFDNGRVWASNERSGAWHQGYGGGIWYSPLYLLVLSTGLEFSKENTFYDLSIGFFF